MHGWKLDGLGEHIASNDSGPRPALLGLGPDTTQDLTVLDLQHFAVELQYICICCHIYIAEIIL